MDDPIKVTSVQHLYHIIASSEQMREFFIALNDARSWRTIGFSDQLDKNGEPKLENRTSYNG